MGDFQNQMDDLEKIAIDDTRHRQKALFDLILSVDRQAMTFFGYSISISAGSGTAFLAGTYGSYRLTFPIAASLTIVFIGGVAAAYFCLRAMRTGNIAAPGRTADFWEWALRGPKENKVVVEAYLAELRSKYNHNEKLNASMANDLKRARNALAIVSAFAPPIGFALNYWDQLKAFLVVNF